MLLRENLYALLRDDILTCRRQPGTELREQELAAEYEVSRAPVRDALLRLEQENLVTILPRQGYRVNPISLADARDLFGLRTVLEPACASQAATAAPDAVLADLERFRSCEPGQDFIDYNRAFHCAIAQASGNRRMAAIACELIEQAERLVRVSIGGLATQERDKVAAEHGAVIDALRQRKAKLAARLIREHVGKAEKRVVSALERHAVII